MTTRCFLAAFAMLAGCAFPEEEPKGPLVQSCVDSRTGERFELDRRKVKSAAASILGGKVLVFTDENGRQRRYTEADEPFVHCKVLKA